MNVEKPGQSSESTKHGRIKITQPETGITRLQIQKEGFSYKGLFTLLIIVLWLLMIMIWTILLLQINRSLVAISIPFWILGFVTLRLSLKVIMASQEIVVSKNEISVFKTESSKTAHITFKRQDIESIIFVEGAYKALSGITRKGNYPAIISHQEAFGFGERCTKEEKQFLFDTIKNLTGF